MNTADILTQCRRIPGVRVETDEREAALFLNSPEGTGEMRFVPVFPGVTLAQISVSAPIWPAPQLEGAGPESRGPLIVNYCAKGRCELVLNDNRRVFLSAGEVSLTERFAQDEYIYPGRSYEGIELFIDPETASGGCGPVSALFGLDLSRLQKTYCPAGETYLAKFPLPAALYDRLRGSAEGPVVALQTAVLDFLSLLLERPAEKSPQTVYYTKAQVEIAKQIESAISLDPAKPHTAREFAERFSISETSVKNYFSGVFGESISRYALRLRMELAAELLSGTRLSVIEVANRAGYLNQSKFSAAFRRQYGCTPLEYRRKQHVRELIAH